MEKKKKEVLKTKMNSKHKLYKPVQSVNIGRSKTRKTLAQGRLEASPGPGELVSNLSDSQHLGRAGAEYFPTTSEINLIREFESGPGTAETGWINSSVTPRKLKPHLIQAASPSISHPVHALDLSDGEHEPARSAISPVHNSVLVVDALGASKSPDDSEVTFKARYEPSPVKVICHSPAVVRHDLSKTSGSVRVAQRIEVDHPPSVSLLEEEYSHVPSHIDSPRRHLSPLIRKHAQKSELQEVTSENAAVASTATSRYPQPNFDDTLSSITSGRAEQIQRDLFNGDTTSQCSVDSGSSSLDNILGHSKKSVKVKLNSSKKKKKDRVVVSRYMSAPYQAANTNSLSSKKLLQQTVSSAGASRAGKPSSSEHHKSSITTSTKRPVRHVAERPRTLTPTNVSTQQAVGGGAKTSTPTQEDAHIPHTIDASAIAHDVSAIAPPSRKAVHGNGISSQKPAPSNDFTQDPFSQTLLSNVSSIPEASFIGPPKEKKKLTPESAQNQLDLLYHQYLQWLFTETKAKKTFQEQERKAMAQVFGLWEHVEKKQAIVTELEQSIAYMQHANILDDQIELQRSGLGPIVSSLPSFQHDHSQMTKALDTTRHYITTKGIHVPADEDHYQDQLTGAVEESIQLLGHLSLLTRAQTPGVVGFSECLDALERNVAKEQAQLLQCQELLAAAQSLATHEASLKIGSHYISQ